MLEILKLLFSNFWTWAGGLIYLLIICGTITQIKLITIERRR